MFRQKIIMDNLIETIKRLFSRDHKSGERHLSLADPELVLDPGSVQDLMQLLEKTEEGQYTCEETFDLLDEYVDLVVDDQQAELIMPLVKGHLDCCPDCSERYETLLTILESS